MVNLLAPLGHFAVAVGVMFGQLSTSHPADTGLRPASAPPARCAGRHQPRHIQTCRLAGKRHAPIRLAKTTQRKRAGRPTPTPPHTGQPVPAPAHATTASPAPTAPGDSTTPTPVATPVTLVPTPVSPASVGTPSISGSANVGSTLHASLGLWANDPASY